MTKPILHPKTVREIISRTISVSYTHLDVYKRQTEACTQYYEDGRKINDEIMAQAMEGVKKMEEINGKKFGDLKNPLLVSCLLYTSRCV